MTPSECSVGKLPCLHSIASLSNSDHSLLVLSAAQALVSDATAAYRALKAIMTRCS